MQLAIEERYGIGSALLTSLLLHLLLAVGLGLYFVARPAMSPLPPPAVQEPIRLVLRQAPAPPPSAPRSLGSAPRNLPESKVAPEKPMFESDRNSLAASEKPGTGKDAVPSQEGRALPFVGLETQSSAPALRAGDPALPVPSATVPPQARPTPVPSRPSAVSTPDARPRPTATPKIGELALLRQPTPAQRPLPTAPPAPRAEVRPQQPVRPALPGSQYRPEQQKTRIVGGLSNRGRASVATLATPLGRYKKYVEDAIGSRWYYYVKSRMDLVRIGTVQISFRVKPNGKVSNVRVLSNNANEALATASVQAIMEAEIPPIPEGLPEVLEDGALEVDYSFTIYSD